MLHHKFIITVLFLTLQVYLHPTLSTCDNIGNCGVLPKNSVHVIKNPICSYPAVPCPFYDNNSSYELFNRQIWSRVTEQRRDAYSVVCDVFDLTAFKEVIENATSSATIRFGNILHCLYHEDCSITWQRVIIEISKNDECLAQVIRESIQLQ